MTITTRSLPRTNPTDNLEWFLERDDASLDTTVHFGELLARVEWALDQAGEAGE